MGEHRRDERGDGGGQRLRYGACRHVGCDPSRDRTQGFAMKDYLVIYEQAEDGAWGAHSPDVDGVVALGKTRQEVESRMAEALAAHLEYLRDQGRPLPDPRTEAGHVAV